MLEELKLYNTIEELQNEVKDLNGNLLDPNELKKYVMTALKVGTMYIYGYKFDVELPSGLAGEFSGRYDNEIIETMAHICNQIFPNWATLKVLEQFAAEYPKKLIEYLSNFGTKQGLYWLYEKGTWECFLKEVEDSGILPSKVKSTGYYEYILKEATKTTEADVIKFKESFQSRMGNSKAR